MAGARAAEARGQIRIVGKTNLHELAFGVTGINPWFGTPVNPLDPALVPGGSSSGSAVAMGSGEADVAFGSDTGGSIRIPAACCGVVGLKTTRGRVPLDGVRALAPSLDTVGPMGANVEMAVKGMALLEPGFTLAGRAPATRVGRLRLPAAERIDRAIDDALALTELEVVEVDVPEWAAATSTAMTILMAEAWQVHGDLWKAEGERLSPDVSARLEISSLIGSEEVAASWERARDWAASLANLFRKVEVLALPCLAAEPPELADGARLAEMRYVAPFNLAGNPALAMPVASSGRVPASLQLAGPAYSEDLLLSTAALIEAAAGWPGPAAP